MCQNSGLGNAVNPLTLAHPSVPHPDADDRHLGRGEPASRTNRSTHLMGPITPALLDTIRFPTAHSRRPMVTCSLRSP